MDQSSVYATVRTLFGRFGGALAVVRPDDPASVAIRGALAKPPGLDHQLISEVIWGCANRAGEDNRNGGRMAGLLAGLPMPGVELALNDGASERWGAAATCIGVEHGLAVVLENVSSKGDRS